MIWSAPESELRGSAEPSDETSACFASGAHGVPADEYDIRDSYEGGPAAEQSSQGT